jgi:hypothetical protein
MGNPTIKLDAGDQLIVGGVVTAATGQSATGSGGSKEVMAEFDKNPLKLVTGTITFSNAYATTGEDISFIWKQFRPTARDLNRNATAWDLRGIAFTDLASIASPATALRQVYIDQATKKAQVFTALGTEATAATDQSGVTVRFIAWGA